MNPPGDHPVFLLDVALDVAHVVAERLVDDGREEFAVRRLQILPGRRCLDYMSVGIDGARRLNGS